MTSSYLCKAENIEVFCESEIIWTGEGIYMSDQPIVYIPFATDSGQVGYVVHNLKSGQQEFIYLNAPAEMEDGKPTVFLSKGESGSPEHDGHGPYYLVAEKFDLSEP